MSNTAAGSATASRLRAELPGRLGPGPKPLAFWEVFLRNTKGLMPPYYEHILSKQDLADIHAYISAMPKGPDYKSIPLLNQ